MADANGHRMVISLSLLGLWPPGVEIVNTACVAKTYPHLLDEMVRLSLEDWQMSHCLER